MERTAGSTSSTDRRRIPDAVVPNPGRIVVGRVTGAHGLRGQLHVRCFADALDWGHVTTLALGHSDGDSATVEQRVFEVGAIAAGRKGEIRIALKGVETREAADELVGRLLLVDARELAPTEEGEYYGYELIGCRVEGEENERIGVVKDIWSTGAPDLLVVATDDGGEVLIPLAQEMLLEVDIAGRRIAVAPIPGLLNGS